MRLAAAGPDVKVEQVYLTRGLPNTSGGSVLVGDTLYGTTREGLVAADLRPGTIRWQSAGIGGGSIVAADGHLYIHGENGDVAAGRGGSGRVPERAASVPQISLKHATAMEKAWSIRLSPTAGCTSAIAGRLVLRRQRTEVTANAPNRSSWPLNDNWLIAADMCVCFLMLITVRRHLPASR